MPKSVTPFGQRFWNKFRAEVTQIADARVLHHLDNHRPRGVAMLPVVIGSNDVPLASSGTACCKIKVPFPINIDELHIAANDICNVTFDIWVQRAAQGVIQDASFAASIVDPNFPQLVDTMETIILPVVTPLTGPGPVWTSTYIQPGSLLWIFVTDSDGSTDVVTLNFSDRSVS